jgi:membrane protease YdiL (CAAX protease family)
MVALTIVAASVLGRFLSSLQAILVLMLLYWCGCWVLALRALSRSEMRALYRAPLTRYPLTLALTWLPPAATFAVAFLPSLPRFSLGVLTAVLGIAVINGTTEELFWRGIFYNAFPKNVWLGYLYPTALFTMWHTALALVPGMHYEGGALALLGGAAALGLSWGWVVWQTHDLRSVTVAHILTNTFAFSGLVLLNWNIG